MAIVTNVSYTTSDGKRFKTEAAALAHENRERYASAINEYLATLDFSDISERAREAQKTRVFNSIAGWLNYREARQAAGVV